MSQDPLGRAADDAPSRRESTPPPCSPGTMRLERCRHRGLQARLEDDPDERDDDTGTITSNASSGHGPRRRSAPSTEAVWPPGCAALRARGGSPTRPPPIRGQPNAGSKNTFATPTTEILHGEQHRELASICAAHDGP